MSREVIIGSSSAPTTDIVLHQLCHLSTRMGLENFAQEQCCAVARRSAEKVRGSNPFITPACDIVTMHIHIKHSWSMYSLNNPLGYSEHCTIVHRLFKPSPPSTLECFSVLATIHQSKGPPVPPSICRRILHWNQSINGQVQCRTLVTIFWEIRTARQIWISTQREMENVSIQILSHY